MRKKLQIQLKHILARITMKLLGGESLHSVLQKFGSTGLRPVVYRADSGGQSLQVRGTAFAVVDVTVPDSVARTLRIAGDSNAKWQFCRS